MPDKKDKMVGREMSWFDAYIKLELEMKSRIFKLEERVAALESANTFRTDMRIG